MNDLYPRPARRSGRLTRWAAGLGAVAVLIGGGTILGADLAGGGSAAAADSGQSAALSALVDTGAGPGAGTAVSGSRRLSATRRCGAAGLRAAHVRAAQAHAAQAHAARARSGRPGANHHAAGPRWAAHNHPGRGCFRILRLLRRLPGLHGQLTFSTKNGAHTVSYERGVIMSLASGSDVDNAADGTAWTWDLAAGTLVIRAGAHKVLTASALAAGQRVFVAGPVVSGADHARLILIRA